MTNENRDKIDEQVSSQFPKSHTPGEEHDATMNSLRQGWSLLKKTQRTEIIETEGGVFKLFKKKGRVVRLTRLTDTDDTT